MAGYPANYAFSRRHTEEERAIALASVLLTVTNVAATNLAAEALASLLKRNGGAGCGSLSLKQFAVDGQREIPASLNSPAYRVRTFSIARTNYERRHGALP